MKLRILISAAVLIFFLPLCSSQAITLMTYNIRYDNPKDGINVWPARKDYLQKQLRFFEPDAFGIQEGLDHQVKYLDSCLADYSYVGVGRDDGKTKGEYCAIYYNTGKLKLLSHSTFWLSETPDKPSVGWDAALERICTWALFESIETGKKLMVFNTHFDHIGQVARKNSARLIVEKIKALNMGNYPFAFMGDLNLVPDHEAIQYLGNVFDDAMHSAKDVVFGPEGTSNGFRFDTPVTKRIDYIFTDRTQVRVNKYAILSESIECRYPSDHLPVYVEIELLP